MKAGLFFVAFAVVFCSAIAAFCFGSGQHILGAINVALAVINVVNFAVLMRI